MTPQFEKELQQIKHLNDTPAVWHDYFFTQAIQVLHDNYLRLSLAYSTWILFVCFVFSPQCLLFYL